MICVAALVVVAFDRPKPVTANAAAAVNETRLFLTFVFKIEIPRNGLLF